MTTRVGFIGLGNIGKPIALNVAKAGFDLMAYDLREEPLVELAAAGAKTAHSANEIGAHGEIIELVVVDDAQVEAVTLEEGGVLSGARPGSVIAIHSTVHPRTIRKIAELAEARGVSVIDAEVSGGERGAETQTLCYMVGGDQAAFEKCRPVFETSGANIFHLGDLAMGSMAKLAHNLIAYVNMLSAFEGMKLAETAGLDLSMFQEIVKASAGQSKVADNWVRQRDYKDTYTNGPQGLMQLMHKDLQLALELGHDLGLTLPGAALTQQLISRFLGIKE